MKKEEPRLFIERLSTEKSKEKNDRNEILYDSTYMNKLIERIRNYHYVIDNSENANDITYYNLSLLYKLIDNYASDNDLYPVMSNNYSLYYIEYNGYMFSVFKKKRNGIPNYGCYETYLTKEELPYYIKFDDLKEEKDMTIDDFKTGLIKEFIDMVVKMNNAGFPLYSIQDLVDKITFDIENKEKSRKK